MEENRAEYRRTRNIFSHLLYIIIIVKTSFVMLASIKVSTVLASKVLESLERPFRWAALILIVSTAYQISAIPVIYMLRLIRTRISHSRY